MKINISITDKIGNLPICAEGKKAVTALVSSIIEHLPEPPKPATPHIAFGAVFSMSSCRREYHCLVTKKCNIVLQDPSPASGNIEWNSTNILREDKVITYNIKVAYNNLDEYLKAHPKSTTYLKELFKLQDEHNK